MQKLSVFTTNSIRILSFARVLCTNPVLSIFRFSTNIQPNHNSKLYGTFATRSVGQQQQQQPKQQCNYFDDTRRNLTVNLHRTSSGKDSSKNVKQDFIFNLGKHMLLEGLKKNPPENRVCSPLSANAVLNMLISGSKGQTRDHFVDLLCLEEEELYKSSIKLLDVVRPFKGNSVWVDHQCPLMRSYKELLENVHSADVNSVDLMYKADEVMEEVNSWSRTKTQGMIQTILPETLCYNDTIMIHFELESSDESFNLLYYYCGEYEGFEVLRMSLKGGNKTTAEQDPRSFSMYIFVPSEKNIDHSNCGRRKISLSEFIEELKVDTKAFRKKIIRNKKEISEFSLPTFNVESEISLTSAMQHLGLTLPFKAWKDELMRFVDCPLAELLYVTDITQKTRIQTNARGTSFSAVTYTTLNGPPHQFPAKPSKQKFVADDPFVYMIHDDFFGAVVSVGTMLSTDLTSTDF